MNVSIIYRNPPEPTPQNALLGAGHFSGFIGGALGYVRAHHIELAAVKVELLNGMMLHTVRVPSRGWVAPMGSGDVTGTVDLPPIDSLVFVLLPYGMENLTGATVLFSVFDEANADHAKRLKVGDERKVVAVHEGGIRTTYDRETGNYLVEDIDDAKLKILVDKGNKALSVSDWNDNKINGDSTGLKLESAETDVFIKADGAIELGGNTKQFVTWAELNSALTTFMTALVTALTTTPIIGNGSPQPTWTGLPTSINIDAAKTANIKTGG